MPLHFLSVCPQRRRHVFTLLHPNVTSVKPCYLRLPMNSVGAWLMSETFAAVVTNVWISPDYRNMPSQPVTYTGEGLAKVR